MDARWQRDRGLATTELVVLAPFLILLTFLPLHYGLYWHASQVADFAAAEALDAAVVEGTSEAKAEEIAKAVAAQTGQLTSFTFTMRRSGDDIEIEVTALPRFKLFPDGRTVSARAVGRVERFIPEGER